MRALEPSPPGRSAGYSGEAAVMPGEAAEAPLLWRRVCAEAGAGIPMASPWRSITWTPDSFQGNYERATQLHQKVWRYSVIWRAA